MDIKAQCVFLVFLNKHAEGYSNSFCVDRNDSPSLSESIRGGDERGVSTSIQRFPAALQSIPVYFNAETVALRHNNWRDVF